MGRIFEIIIFCVIAFFVFRFLGRMFDSSPSPKQAKNSAKPQNRQSQDSKVKWDAETVDYEEVEKKDNEKK